MDDTRKNQLNAHDLKQTYEQVYSGDYKNFFTKYVNGQDTSQTNQCIVELWDWKGKKVLDLGCGTGTVASILAERGAIVHGLDFSENAIKKASTKSNQNMSFSVGSLDDISGEYDVIISLGTIEHMETPAHAIEVFSKHLAQEGCVVLTCPNWTNIYRTILLTLHFLFHLRITLTDLHFITHQDVELWASSAKLTIQSWFSYDHSLASGEHMIRDLEDRLPKVFKEVGPVPEKEIADLVNWLKKSISLDDRSPYSGGTALYVLSKEMDL